VGPPPHQAELALATLGGLVGHQRLPGDQRLDPDRQRRLEISWGLPAVCPPLGGRPDAPALVGRRVVVPRAARSGGCHPAVDGQRCSGDERRLVGEQKKRRIGDLLGTAGAAQRD
jgi:hypothetical protein